MGSQNFQNLKVDFCEVKKIFKISNFENFVNPFYSTDRAVSNGKGDITGKFLKVTLLIIFRKTGLSSGKGVAIVHSNYLFLPWPVTVNDQWFKLSLFGAQTGSNMQRLVFDNGRLQRLLWGI